MAGLINSAKSQPTQDSILKKTVAQIEAKVPQEFRKNYDAIVVSGMKIMFDKKTHKQMVQMLQESPDIAQNVAKGISMLIAIIANESGGKVRREAAMLASIVLMTEALDFAAKAMGAQITPDLLAQCTEATKAEMFKLMKITPEMEQQAIQAGQQGQGEQDAAPMPPTDTQQPQPGVM